MDYWPAILVCLANCRPLRKRRVDSTLGMLRNEVVLWYTHMCKHIHTNLYQKMNMQSTCIYKANKNK